MGFKAIIEATSPEVVAKIGNDVVIVVHNAAPDNTIGATIAGPGSLCIDRTNSNLYVNAGTKAVPAWKLVTRAA
ncbi:MAG: hypothetical protein AB1510_02155 [Bacillota bacterium]